MKSNEILSAQLIDVIFDGRNKAYGAYELRNTYSRRIKKALLVTTIVAGLVFGGAVLANSFKKNVTNYRISQAVDLTAIDDKIPEKLPEPIRKPEPVPVKTEIYTAPVIVDKPVLDNPPPTIDDLVGAKIDDFKQDGVADNNISTPAGVGGGKDIVEGKIEKEPEIFTTVEVDAKFNGNWKAFLERNLNPNVAIDNNAPTGRYTVVMQFVVDKDGNVSDIKALTSHGYGMEEEALRVLRKAAKWEPAIQNGIQVKAFRKQGIVFDVQGDE